jgi:hypothetical protein
MEITTKFPLRTKSSPNKEIKRCGVFYEQNLKKNSRVEGMVFKLSHRHLNRTVVLIKSLKELKTSAVLVSEFQLSSKN